MSAQLIEHRALCDSVTDLTIHGFDLDWNNGHDPYYIYYYCSSVDRMHFVLNIL